MNTGDREYYKKWQTGEVIDFIKNLPFCFASAYKYLLRPGKHQHAEDLEKALWYVRRIREDEAIPKQVSQDDTKLLDTALHYAQELKDAGYEHEGLAVLWLAYAEFKDARDSDLNLFLGNAIECLKEALDEERTRVRSL